jgi:hypothetical protein
MAEQLRGLGAMKWPLWGLAICAIGLLLAIGFCGLDAHLHPHSGFGGSWLAGVGFWLALVCALGLVVSVLALIVMGLVRLFRR